ncbi:MAG: NAD-dependent epimerase/dehydratase family protein [Chloroflexi bacterium]|nr:NAD-dependent epimerase/dehydratase family protein [Chloroflexota bacterium]
MTGATGFIGSRLAQRLALEEGAVVTGLGRQLDKVPFLQEAGVDLRRADLRDTAVLRQLLANQEIVFHSAALLSKHRASPEEAQQVNVTAAQDLLRLADEAGARRFVHISSINAYGPPQRLLADETHPLNTEQRDTYGRSKAIGEEAVWETSAGLDLAVTVARPGMVYGPRASSWTIKMVGAIQKGLPVIFGDGGGYASPVFVDNLIDGLMLTAVSPKAPGEAFNFVDPPVDWHTFFGYYGAMCGKKPRRIPMWAANVLALACEKLDLKLPLTRDRLKIYAQQAVFPTTKAETLLSYQPRIGMDEAMQQTEAWLREADFIGRSQESTLSARIGQNDAGPR